MRATPTYSTHSQRGTKAGASVACAQSLHAISPSTARGVAQATAPRGLAAPTPRLASSPPPDPSQDPDAIWSHSRAGGSTQPRSVSQAWTSDGCCLGVLLAHRELRSEQPWGMPGQTQAMCRHVLLPSSRSFAAGSRQMSSRGFVPCGWPSQAALSGLATQFITCTQNGARGTVTYVGTHG